MAGAYGGRVARPVAGPAPLPVPAAPPAFAEPEPVDPAEESVRRAVTDAAATLPAGAVPAASVPAATSPVATSPVETGRWERVVPAVRERLPMWLQLRCGLEPRTLAALAVLLVTAAVFAAVHFWSARPQSVRAPDPVSEGVHASASESAADPAMDPGAGRARTPDPSPGPPPTGGPGGQIVVDVSGKVRRPGIYPLPTGARVADALRAAGGVRTGVDLTGLNRARVLMDGEQVVVGALPGSPVSGVPGGAATGGASTGGGGGSAAGPVSLNSATVEQLDTLPGVGPVLAQHIVDYRTQHGGFRSVGELREVNGIGDRRFADLQPLVRP